MNTKRLNLILDTDIGGDCDDTMALVYLFYAQRNLGVDLKAVTSANGYEQSTMLIKTFFDFYNQPACPIGKASSGTKSFDTYATAVTERFPTEKCEFEDSVKVLRRTLNDSNNVTLCAIGPLTNIAQLLNSASDEISEYNGVELIKRKCDKLVLMAGSFVKGDDGKNVPEFNAYVDIKATQDVVNLCPVPIVFLPFETGLDMLTGKPAMQNEKSTTPLSYAFNIYCSKNQPDGRHSWDPATLVYAIEGERDFFTQSKTGTITVDEEGRTSFSTHKNGLHTFLTIAKKDNQSELQRKKEIAQYIDDCAQKLTKMQNNA